MVVAMHNFHVPLGWMGVDLFFVLSGFLITRILLDTKTCAGYLKTFYARRFLRIFPVYYLTLLLVWLYYAQSDYSKVEGRLWWYAAYLADFNWLAPDKYVRLLIHTWSLAIEEQFYFVWPWLVGWLTRSRLMQACGVLLLANLAVRVCLSLTQGNEGFYCFSILTRSDGLMAGALLALLVDAGMRHTPENRWSALRIMAVCSVVLAALALTGHLSLSKGTLPMSLCGLPAVVAGSTAALWWAMGLDPASRLHRWLTWKPLTSTGRISYGLYLLHLPIAFVCRPWLNFPATWAGRLGEGLVLTAIAFGVAVVSWHCFEAPLNRLKRHWEYQAKPSGP